jgi:ribonucleoside-diphosphate reductase subunit M1
VNEIEECNNIFNNFLSQGLKTGMYYLRSRPAAQAIQFTVDQETLKKTPEEQAKENEEAIACSLQNKEACMMCSG